MLFARAYETSSPLDTDTDADTESRVKGEMWYEAEVDFLHANPGLKFIFSQAAQNDLYLLALPTDS